MKVVHLVASPLSLGFLRGQPGYAAANGVEVHVVSPPGDQLDQFAAEERVQTHTIDITRSISPISDLAALWRLTLLFRRLRPDIVHSHTPKAGLLGMTAATAARVRGRIHHLRGLPTSTARGVLRFLLVWSDRLTCALAHRVICVSESLRNEALDGGICRASKMCVIGRGSGQGVDARHQFNPASFTKSESMARRSALGIPEGASVVGFVGRLTADKGLAELHQAWELLKRSHPTLQLLLVGSTDTRLPLANDLVARFAADARVHHVEWTANVAALYSLMDLVVLPTYREGFPNVVLEAGAMELPVVATDVTGCIDAVLPGETGLLVHPHDPHALACAIESYLASPVRRRAHGAAGRRRVLENFTPELVWEGILSEYRSISA
jgi:glycosyltransferase involved in cell wall biosynthesis